MNLTNYLDEMRERHEVLQREYGELLALVVNPSTTAEARERLRELEAKVDLLMPEAIRAAELVVIFWRAGLGGQDVPVEYEDAVVDYMESGWGDPHAILATILRGGAE